MTLVKGLVIGALVLALAAGALIWEGRILERIFSIGRVPVIDFATLQRADTPNQYLMCPSKFCPAYIDDLPPDYAASVAEVRAAWETLLKSEPRVKELRRDPLGRQIDYVQRSRLMRFPDLITIRFIELGEGKTTVAIYSRSIYGERDMGVNKARIRDWIGRLNTMLKLS